MTRVGRPRRRIAAGVATAVVALTVGPWVGPAAASTMHEPAAAPAAAVAAVSGWHSGYCYAGQPSAVTVVVDFGDLGAPTTIRCVTGLPAGATGYDALRLGGLNPGGTTGDGSAFVCRLAGRPSSSQVIPIPGNPGYTEQCAQTPPFAARWVYWHASGGGGWAYSSRGAQSSTIRPGTLEGWSFLHSATVASPAPVPPRAGTDVPPAPPPPSTQVPTTPHPPSPPPAATTAAPAPGTTAARPTTPRQDAPATTTRTPPRAPAVERTTVNAASTATSSGSGVSGSATTSTSPSATSGVSGLSGGIAAAGSAPSSSAPGESPSPALSHADPTSAVAPGATADPPRTTGNARWLTIVAVLLLVGAVVAAVAIGRRRGRTS